MHIVIDAHLAVKQIDGVTRYLIGLLSELPKIDNRVRYTILELPKAKSGLPKYIFDFPNVKRYELNLMGPSLKQHFILPGLLKKLKADGYHHPQFDMPRFLNTPTVITVHDLKYVFHHEFLSKRSKLKSLYARQSLKYSIRAATKIIAVSQNTKNDILRFSNLAEPNKIDVLYHGIDCKKPILKGEKVSRAFQNDYILFVGTRRPHKNIEGLIKALAVLKSQYHSNINLVIAGKSYSDYQEPENLAITLGLQEDIHFVDFVPDQELAYLYDSAKVIVLPSFYEGFGFPVLEAMLHKKPVVASNVTSLPEVVGDAGLLVEPNDPNDIANKIFQIISNDKLQQELSKKAEGRVKEFSWKGVAQLTLRTYQEAFSKNT